MDNASILITGGTGSFGQALVREIVTKYKPRRLVIFSRDELKQSQMADKFRHADYPYLRYFIGDVRDVDRLEMAMRDIEFVVHAAALKQVITAEYNPFECVHTNILGAENVVRAALRNQVKKIISLSTDKAVNPINLYGATKLASDKIFIAANALSADIGSRFSIVRYGNVSGSRGSVVPLFQRLIEEGATKLPITHPDMTRFWISLEQAVDFVISSLTTMRGGEIFLPKLPSIRISDLAEVIGPKIPHEIVGIRPGEKLHETLITSNDARMTVEFEDYYVIEPEFTFWKWTSHLDDGGKKVDEGFSYNSDSNSWWLQKNEIQKLLESSSL